MQWHQLDHMQTIQSRQIIIPLICGLTTQLCTIQMLILAPNQQHQSTEGKLNVSEIRLNHFKPHKLLDTSHCASSVDSATLRSSARLNFCRKPSHSSFSNNMFCCTALQTTIYSSSWRFFLHFSKIKLWKQSHTWNAYSSSEIDKNCCILKFHLNCCTWKGNVSCMLIRPLQDCSKNPVILYMFQHLCQCHINKTGFTFSLL